MSDEPMLSEPIAVTFTVIEALEALGVPYLIGGSLASAVHGAVRATMDADLVADLQMQHRDELDLPYLQRWAAQLGLSDLLDKALAEAA
ncbi:MAG: hypothetical protein ACE5LU_19905 [Anaerolineae bacterium]